MRNVKEALDKHDGTQRALQWRYTPTAEYLARLRPDPLVPGFYERLYMWRDCINAVCAGYAFRDEDFVGDVFRRACNW